MATLRELYEQSKLPPRAASSGESVIPPKRVRGDAAELRYIGKAVRVAVAGAFVYTGILEAVNTFTVDLRGDTGLILLFKGQILSIQEVEAL